MVGYSSALLSRTEVAENTMAFHFEKPPGFQFKAGQYLNLTLLNSQPESSNGLTHTFSIASSPLSGELAVTTRMRDTLFKRTLSSLPIGAEVRIEGPMGSFTLHNNTAKPAVLLAGGIGIAPFLSILSYAAGKRLHHPIFLFYANRCLEDAAFMEALWKLEKANPRFRFIPTFTRITKNYRGWKGETGRISRELLSTYLGKVEVPIYYVAGPPTMVAAARRTLNEASVDDDNIRTEEFAGY
jgi:ferredoxin-NADP reductase